MVFPVVMYGCESWTIKKDECWRIDGLWTVMLKKILESPLNCKKIKPIYPKGNHPWIFIGRTDAKAEAPILWPPDVKNWLIGKDPDAGKDWMQEEKGTTEVEMVGWHHWLNGHEFEQALGVGNGLQHTRLPCPPPSPRVCSNSCPSNWWCHPTLSFSVVPFSSCPQSFPASGSFLMSRLFSSGGQSVGA